MKYWIKDNWFKLAIVLIFTWLLFIFTFKEGIRVSVCHKEEGLKAHIARLESDCW